MSNLAELARYTGNSTKHDLTIGWLGRRICRHWLVSTTTGLPAGKLASLFQFSFGVADPFRLDLQVSSWLINTEYLLCASHPIYFFMLECILC